MILFYLICSRKSLYLSAAADNNLGNTVVQCMGSM